jgi:hypothetical protein
MFVYAAELGALFLVALIAPLALADPSGLAKRIEDNALVGIAGGVGVGALIHVVGSAFWNMSFRYEHPWLAKYIEWLGYAGRVLRHHRNRAGRTPHATAYWRIPTAAGFDTTKSVAAQITPDEGAVAELVTAYEFLQEAPSELVAWTRRRFERFADSMNSGLAIALGVVFSLLLPEPRSGWSPWIEFLLVTIALITIIYGWSQRRQAEQMIELYLVRLPRYQARPAGGGPAAPVVASSSAGSRPP